MNIQYKRNLNTTCLVVEAEQVYQEDYQMRMLRENHPEGLLTLRGRGVNDKSQYHYDISGKVCMKAMFEKANMNHEDMEQFIRQLNHTVKRVRSYLLDMNRILLDPECIFYEKGEFYFCYYPLQEGDLCKAFHKLSEYFVSQADYGDRDGVFLAYELHKVTMEDNYSLDQIYAKLQEVLKECRDEEEEGEEEDLEVRFKEQENDWIGEAEQGIHAIKEQVEGWNPMKRIWRRHKRPKWGEWEDTFMEEEQESPAK